MRPKPETTPPADWQTALPVIDVSSLKPAIDELAGLKKEASRQFGPTRRHISRTSRAIEKDARQLVNAIADIGDLPQSGTVVHLLTAKRFALFDVIRAVLELRTPATISFLGICTLGFSPANVEGLAAMLDSGQVGRLDFIFSIYFRSLEKANCQHMAAELGRRGARIVAFLQHSKILVIETTDAQNYVIEASANLRSCASLEQMAIFNDAELAAFHRGWIDSLFTEHRK